MAVTKADYEGLAAFRKSLRKFLRYVEEAAREEKVTPQQYQALLAIHGQPGKDWASIMELVEYLQIKHHAVVGLVDRCQEQGLLNRRHHDEDRRGGGGRLTDEGRAGLERITSKSLHELRHMRELTKALEDVGG